MMTIFEETFVDIKNFFILRLVVVDLSNLSQKSGLFDCDDDECLFS